MLFTKSSPRVRSSIAVASVLFASTLASLGVSSSPAQADQAASAARAKASSSFKIATFNILGSQHTAGKGGWGPGTQRARLTARLIKARGIDVIGMQEVQKDQLRVLKRRLTGYNIWPKQRLGGGGVRLQIAYKKAQFKMLDHGRIDTAFDRQRRPIPWVLLRDRSSKRKLYVVNIHNSARNLESERDSATRRQIKLIKRLRATNKAVFALGDMNEHTEWFCKVGGNTDLIAPHGGSALKKKCTPPDGRMLIDWIMGAGRMKFSNYGWLSGRLVRRASDHNLVHATVTMR